MGLTKDIIEKLDIEAIVREFYPGDKITDSVTNGWIRVHALSREDKDPSANINLETGYYKDFGSNGESAGLFDWLPRTGHFADWRDARKTLAAKAGVKIPKTKAQKKADFDERWEDLVLYGPKTLLEFPLYARGLCKRREGLTVEALHAFGAKIAKYDNIKYQDHSTTQQKINSVVVLPIYNIRVPRPDMAPIAGAVIFPNNGHYVYLADGDAKKNINRGRSGLVGKHGLEILMHQEKRRNIIFVIKTEGPSDALALWAAMSPEDREHFPIVTNSSGAGESANLDSWGKLLIDLPVVTIHDSDKPGQEGIKNWQKFVGPMCSKFCNIVLHDEIKEKKGLDLRDWLNAGGTWLELKAMILNAEPLEVSERQALLDMSDTDRVLFQIKCTVIGDLGGHYNKVQIFSQLRREYFDISPSSLNEIQVMQMFGGHIGRMTKMGTLSVENIREAIADKTSELGKISTHRRLGPGIWVSEDKQQLAIVGEQGLFVYDNAGGIVKQREPFFDGRAALFRTSDFTKPWFDEDKLTRYIRKAHEDREWAIGVLSELDKLFRVWDNLKYQAHDSFLLAGLVIATLLQDIWELRPQVWLSGPTDSGKSQKARILEKMFGPLMARMDAPTEAGFRNYIQNQKRFCVIDEFEKSSARKKIIETLRITTKGGVIPKATADHNLVLFEIKHLPWFTGINRGEAKIAADNNRVILIDLLAPTPEQRKKGQKFPTDEELRELGQKAIAVAIAYWKPMLKMEADLGRLSVEGVAHRLVECFAVPTAVHATVMDYDVESAEKMLTEMLLARGDDVKQIAHADESRMLEFILRQPIRVGSAEYPLMLLAMNDLPLTNTGSEMTSRDYAGMNGVRMVNGGDWFFHADTITSRDWWKNQTTGARRHQTGAGRANPGLEAS